MNVRRIYLFFCGCAFSLCILAQPRMQVDGDVVNMGEIMFQVPAKVSFTVHNTGNEELVIKSVRPSCGCVVTDWTRTPIPSGKSGYVEATYDAKMLGVFQKDIEVLTNETEEPVYLHFQGRVVTKVTDFSGAFPIDMGNIRLSAKRVVFDNVNHGDQPVVELQVLNKGRNSYKPQLMHLPPYLKAHYVPEVLAGGRIGKIELTLDSEKLDAMGITQTAIYLSRNEGERVSKDNEISVSVVLLPEFSSSASSASVPSMDLSTDVLDMGTLNGSKKKTMSVYIKNTGRQRLEIGGLQVFDKALSVDLSSKKVEPDEVVRLKVKVDAEYLECGSSELFVLLVANDPYNPKRKITIKVNKDNNQERWSIRKIVKSIRD